MTISTNDFDKLKNNSFFNKLMSEAKDNKISSERDALDFVSKNLPKDKADKFKSIIEDKDKINTLLSSDEAKKLMQFLMGSEKNE